jgi:uncharacterized coiled-coil DUF342 family protein
MKEIKEIKEAVSNAKQEIKALLKQAWSEYKVLWANAKADVQFEQHQKAINKLAIQAQLEIDELKINHNENFWR